MQEPDDNALLREYAERDSEEAFATLVTRHVNKVYSIALRQTRNPHQAEEITQAVFVILAKKSRSLPRTAIVSGWLCRTTQLTAVTFLRSEIRRARREQEAYMQTLLNEPESDVWPQIAPLLDVAMAGLSEKDHHAIVLRFYDGKSMREIGLALGANEETAKKRVSRAVEKLRMFFSKRGVVIPAAVLTAAISANSVQAAPALLTKAATAAAVAKGATTSTATLTLVKGALKIMAWTKAKTVIVIGLAVAIAGTSSTLIIQHQRHAKATTDFPKSSWTKAGHADAPSALASVLQDASQGNGDKLLEDLSPGMRRNFQRQFEKQIQAQGITLAQLISQMGSHWSSGVDGFHIVSQETNADQVALHIQPQGRNHPQTFTMKQVNGEWKLHNFKDE